MSCQDDLSHLMPTLYSQVNLAAKSDGTADLPPNAKEHKFVGSPSPVLPGSVARLQCQKQQEQLQQRQNYPALQRHIEYQPDMRQRKGTGRRVARRAFHLELR